MPSALIVGDPAKDPTGLMYEAAFVACGVHVEWLSIDGFLRLLCADPPSLLNAIEVGDRYFSGSLDQVDLSVAHAALRRFSFGFLVSNDYEELAPYIFYVFRELGFATTNTPAAVLRASDKHQTFQVLSAHGVVLPKTRIALNQSQMQEAIAALGAPVVIKPLMGSRGVGVVRLQSIDDYVEPPSFPCLVQQYIECGAYDKRLIYVNGKFVVAMKRCAAPGDFRSNLALGGRAEPCVVTEADLELGSRIMEAMDLSFAGLDIGTVTQVLPGREYLAEGQPFCLEVNAMPALDMPLHIAGIDGSLDVVDMVMKRVN